MIEGPAPTDLHARLKTVIATELNPAIPCALSNVAALRGPSVVGAEVKRIRAQQRQWTTRCEWEGGPLRRPPVAHAEGIGACAEGESEDRLADARTAKHTLIKAGVFTPPVPSVVGN